MKITLFFGSFNPVHIGHLLMVQHVLNHTAQQEVWFVCTPHNPDKDKKSLLHAEDRLHLVRLAIADHPQLRVCDIEFYLQAPFYTAKTLMHLKQKYPEHQFSILMGQDNAVSLPKWQNYEYILQEFPLFIYPRSIAENLDDHLAATVYFLKDMPIFQISASYVREQLKLKKSIRYLVPESVRLYIEKMGFYQ